MKRLPPQSRLNAIDFSKTNAGEDRPIWNQAPNGETWVRNVSRPTLEPFLPKPEQSNGAAVIVIPGGGFQFVSLSNEGWPVARALAELGFTAFVLTYRTQPTPEDDAKFAVGLEAQFKGRARGQGPDNVILQQLALATQDAQAAFSYVHDNAEAWHIKPDHIGLLGFSAGAMTALGVALAGERPHVLGLLYPPMIRVDPPENPPPMFVALASDDPLFGGQGLGLVEAWQQGGGAVELHYYERGGHGFGSHTKGTTSDAWFTQFVDWMSKRP
jgi:acetyl esterase/lipase